MTKTEVLAVLKCSQAELGRMLGITRSAVAQWAADDPIPEAQMLKLRYELRPEAFGGQAAGHGQQEAA